MTALTFATELAAVDAAFAEPVRIPPIADFAREIDWDLAEYEIDHNDFFWEVDLLAQKTVCPTISAITYAGEYLNDYVLAHCTDQEFSDAQVNTWAEEAMAEDPHFRNEFAHFYKDGIIFELHAKRLKDAREWNRNLGEY